MNNFIIFHFSSESDKLQVQNLHWFCGRDERKRDKGRDLPSTGQPTQRRTSVNSKTKKVEPIWFVCSVPRFCFNSLSWCVGIYKRCDFGHRIYHILNQCGPHKVVVCASCILKSSLSLPCPFLGCQTGLEGKDPESLVEVERTPSKEHKDLVADLALLPCCDTLHLRGDINSSCYDQSRYFFRLIS